jgi:hypothetical protein
MVKKEKHAAVAVAAVAMEQMSAYSPFFILNPA